MNGGVLFTGISELRTPELVVSDAVLAVEGGALAWLGSAGELPEPYCSWPRRDLQGNAVLPGLVDSHTHLIWAGSRIEEYGRRSRGDSYENILAAGGGIHATVAATQAASEEELLLAALTRARALLQDGVTTLEVKSGYGLTIEHELKMLQVARRLAESQPQRIVPTLLAHVVPRDTPRQTYVEMFTSELIPEVRRQGLAEAVDVFSDEGAFSLGETRTILEAALRHDLAIKLHAEQIAPTGAARLAAEMGALSADHLEQSSRDDWAELVSAGTVATILPGAAVVLRKPFPDARAMWDAGAKVAVATDHNPGSSPLYSLTLALQLAISLGGLSVDEALVAGTRNAADALRRPDLGRLEVASAADFLVVDGKDSLLPLYAWGARTIRSVYIGGVKVMSVDDDRTWPGFDRASDAGGRH
jgi:imidazolonepropionase